MVVLVAGDRNWSDWELFGKVLDLIHAKNPITLVVHGGARGADRMAGFWAALNKVPLRVYRADWGKHNKQAGPIRNRLMLESHPELQLVVAFHDSIDWSKGTKDMVEASRRAGKSVLIVQHGSSWKYWKKKINGKLDFKVVEAPLL